MIRVTILSLSTLTAAIVSAHALAPEVMPLPGARSAAVAAPLAEAEAGKQMAQRDETRWDEGAAAARAAPSLPLRKMSAEELRRTGPHASVNGGPVALAPTEAAPRPPR